MGPNVTHTLAFWTLKALPPAHLLSSTPGAGPSIAISMPFDPPQWQSALPEIPASITLDQFMLDEQYGHRRPGASRPSLVCGVTSKSYDFAAITDRVENLSRALHLLPQFRPTSIKTGSEWDKVAAIYSFNCIDYIPVALAVHKLGGVVTTVSAAYTPSQLQTQLAHANAQVLFTCYDLLSNAETACDSIGLSRECIFILPTGSDTSPLTSQKNSYKSVDELISYGSSLAPLRYPQLSSRKGARRTAVLAYSSGTSGLPKAAKLSHRNIIANITQVVNFEAISRNQQANALELKVYFETCLCVAPVSHIYGFTQISLVSMYRGDTIVVLPRYSLDAMMQAVERYKIARLYLVPPMIIDIIRNAQRLKTAYDLSSVRSIFTVASPVREETIVQLTNLFPTWTVLQAYGFTESAGGISLTSSDDVYSGSCGSILAGNRVRLMSLDSKEDITAHNSPGEIYVSGPSIFLGYHESEEANRETFVDLEDGRYMRTGDEALINQSANGNQHIFITGRIKECVTCPPKISRVR